MFASLLKMRKFEFLRTVTFLTFCINFIYEKILKFSKLLDFLSDLKVAKFENLETVKLKNST